MQDHCKPVGTQNANCTLVLYQFHIQPPPPPGLGENSHKRVIFMLLPMQLITTGKNRISKGGGAIFDVIYLVSTENKLSELGTQQYCHDNETMILGHYYYIWCGYYPF